MEIARHSAGHRPDSLCSTAGIAIRGAGTAEKTIVRYAGSKAVVLHLLAQPAAGGLRLF